MNKPTNLNQARNYVEAENGHKLHKKTQIEQEADIFNERGHLL